MKPTDRPQSDDLWPWYFITGVYLSLGILVLVKRWDEIGSLWATPAIGTAGIARLPLNSIGDILAGFFAPLAFLWLFVATQLQRKELRLQRLELADTRAVLADQKGELEKSAKESNAQTEIMQQTLETTNQSARYQEFGIRLYFIAKSLLPYRNMQIDIYNKGGGGQGTVIFLNSAPGILSQNDQSSVDDFFIEYRRSMVAIVSQLNEGRVITPMQPTRDRFKASVVEAMIQLDTVLLPNSFADNGLIKSRTVGLGLHTLRDCLRIADNYLDQDLILAQDGS